MGQEQSGGEESQSGTGAGKMMSFTFEKVIQKNQQTSVGFLILFQLLLVLVLTRVVFFFLCIVVRTYT